METLKSSSTEQRFWYKVTKTKYCWVFKVGKSLHPSAQYGILHVGGTKHVRAHRFSWELHFGAIPEGMHVCHKCDNPSCVRPTHLFLGDDKDNMRDCIRKGRHVTQKKNRDFYWKGEQLWMTKMTPKQVREARKMHSEGRASGRKLAIMFGMSETAMRQLLNRYTWKHI